jgi:hypothetical protein
MIQKADLNVGFFVVRSAVSASAARAASLHRRPCLAMGRLESCLPDHQNQGKTRQPPFGGFS